MKGKPNVCMICGKPRQFHYLYCPRCRRLVGNGHSERFRRAALILAWCAAIDGFLCHYTGVKLEEYDTSSPWYITYDHVIPGKKGDLVVCAFFMNDMKSDLSGEEFWAIVMEHDRHRKGAAFNKDIVQFLYWTRKPRPEPVPVQEMRNLRLAMVTACVICGGKPDHHSRYCTRCLRHHPYLPGRAQAMKNAWNKEKGGFLDYYTGVRLEEEDIDNPWFMVFDHLIPGKRGDLVVTSMLFNSMKTALSEDEFYLVMNELARHLEGAPFDRDVVKFEYWKQK